MARFGMRLFALAIASSCAGTFTYVPTTAGAGPVVSSTRWSFLWGVIRDDVGADRPAPSSCASDPNRFECLKCHGNGVTKITVSTNVGFELLSIVTLGLATPLTVSYQCAAPAGA